MLDQPKKRIGHVIISSIMLCAPHGQSHGGEQGSEQTRRVLRKDWLRVRSSAQFLTANSLAREDPVWSKFLSNRPVALFRCFCFVLPTTTGMNALVCMIR